MENNSGDGRAMLDRAFEDQNVQAALMHLIEKKNNTDATGLELYKLPEFWRINGGFYREICLNGQYMPEPVTFFDIPKKSGAPRRIARYAHIDILIARMLHQVLEPEVRPLLEESCCAYVPGRSIADAVDRAAQWAREGATYCAKLDIADFFDNIHLRKLSEELRLILPEPGLLKVLSALLLARRNGETEPPERGVLQGGPLSPLMSNVYLRRFDRQWRTRQYMRYADDVFCFAHSREAAEEWLAQAKDCLRRDYLLDAAEEKCGVFEVEGLEMLGYAAFPHIMPGAGFRFENRNRRPPRDAINALLSFGNVVLYNRIATEIHKERLEISLSFLHAAESGRNSLSLDIAEVYKPLIVDRAIFALVNRKELRADEHFMDTSEGGVYLNQAGKRIFLKELNERFFTYMTVDGRAKTWQSCIRDDVAALKKAILTDGDFRPHRH